MLKSFQADCHTSSFDYEEPYQISIKIHRYKVPFKTVQTTQISYFTSLLMQQLNRSFLLTILYTNSEHCFLRICVWSSAYLKFKPTIDIVQTIVGDRIYSNQILQKSSDNKESTREIIKWSILKYMPLKAFHTSTVDRRWDPKINEVTISRWDLVIPHRTM